MGARASVGRFPFAGALRALATLTIVFYHCWEAAWNSHRITWSSQACAMLGQVGVACFFALSGFLLGRRYIAAVLNGKPLPRWQDFTRDRFLRIYPL
ncbi:MAG: acyltransferase family protein, partial [Candidatus Eremiobacteraeota bacterium]|nr:acyltransferase family protein [Candidatus Eremiobacteraeota bacterium]